MSINLICLYNHVCDENYFCDCLWSIICNLLKLSFVKITGYQCSQQALNQTCMHVIAISQGSYFNLPLFCLSSLCQKEIYFMPGTWTLDSSLGKFFLCYLFDYRKPRSMHKVFFLFGIFFIAFVVRFSSSSIVYDKTFFFGGGENNFTLCKT